MILRGADVLSHVITGSDGHRGDGMSEKKEIGVLVRLETETWLSACTFVYSLTRNQDGSRRWSFVVLLAVMK